MNLRLVLKCILAQLLGSILYPVLKSFEGLVMEHEIMSQSGVRMQSPNGKETAMVPQDKVQFYLQQGGKVIQ